MKLHFTKMTGAGNDFVLVDNRTAGLAPDWSTLAPGLCDRRFGIGADGLLVLEPSTIAAFAMRYFNADGSYGGMCGNGGRCVARYQIGDNVGAGTTFEALDYIYRATLVDARSVRLEMRPSEAPRMNVRLELQAGIATAHVVNTGSPHAVLFVDELPEALQLSVKLHGVVELGREIRNHKEFQPEGTNVDFVRREADTGEVVMRTYERGVEDETLACGTGAVASALVTAARFGLDAPVSVITRSRQSLEVGFKRGVKTFGEITLTGPAEIVYSGTIKI